MFKINYLSIKLRHESQPSFNSFLLACFKLLTDLIILFAMSYMYIKLQAQVRNTCCLDFWTTTPITIDYDNTIIHTYIRNKQKCKKKTYRTSTDPQILMFELARKPEQERMNKSNASKREKKFMYLSWDKKLCYSKLLTTLSLHSFNKHFSAFWSLVFFLSNLTYTTKLKD